MYENNLVPRPPTNPELGIHNDGVSAALKLLSRNIDIHEEKEREWGTIQELFEEGFEVYNPKGTKKISSKLIMQALWKLAGKMKPLDFLVKGTGVNQLVENTVTDGISTVLDKGNYHRVLRDKGGMFFKMLLFGDAFFQIGSRTGEIEYPIQFKGCSLSDIYIDNQATAMRDPISGGSATEAVNIYRYSWDQFLMYYPEQAKKVGLGEVTRSGTNLKQLEKKWLQIYKENDASKWQVEVAHYYNAPVKRYTVFAGVNCTVIEDLQAYNYPYIMNGEGYIPIIHKLCFPSSEGFYNYGIGHILYDLALIMARMDNMAINHAEDNIYPINLVNVPQGESSKFFNKILMAHRQRAAGGKGYAVNEFNPSNPNARVSLEPFQTAPITTEWERAFTRLEQQITRLGIQLDAVDRGATTTATQILAEEENADAVVKQIMEYNASETKFTIEVVIDMIKKLVPEYSNLPIDTNTKIKTATGEQQLENITLGMIADALRRNMFSVKINSRSGSIPSNLMQQAQIAKLMQAIPPGSQAWNKLTVQLAELNDRDISIEELMPQSIESPEPKAASTGMEAEMIPETSEAKALPPNVKGQGKVPV